METVTDLVTNLNDGQEHIRMGLDGPVENEALPESFPLSPAASTGHMPADEGHTTEIDLEDAKVNLSKKMVWVRATQAGHSNSQSVLNDPEVSRALKQAMADAAKCDGGRTIKVVVARAVQPNLESSAAPQVAVLSCTPKKRKRRPKMLLLQSLGTQTDTENSLSESVANAPSSSPRKRVAASVKPRQILWKYTLYPERTEREQRAATLPKPEPQKKMCERCGILYRGSTDAHHKVCPMTPRELLQCDVCHKFLCGGPDRVRSHKERVHKKVKRHVCETCGRGFFTRTSLVSHNLIHEGEKPFQCEECGATFRKRTHLGYHMTTHTGMKRMRCIECGRQYMYPSLLKKHKCYRDMIKRKMEEQGLDGDSSCTVDISEIAVMLKNPLNRLPLKKYSKQC